MTGNETKDVIDIHEIINQVAENKNVSLSILLMDGNTHINVYPYTESDEKAQWIENANGNFRCSKCNRYSEHPYHFCPNCGEQMGVYIKR